MINKKKESVIVSRIIIVTIYILIIAFFLYLPKISKFIFTHKKNINVYAFTDMITPETINAFIKKTNIEVNIKYFDTNEELLAKFKINKGKGYDLITVSNSTLELLRKDNLLQKIDISKISNFNQLDKRLLGHYFDPQNEYCIPYFWSINGIIFKKTILDKLNLDATWDLIFKNNGFKICMIDSPQEIIYLAAIHLFGKTNNLTKENLHEIKNLLIQQKSWVEIYMLASLQYYLFGNVVPVAVSSSAFVKKILELSDNFDFVVPKQGSILLIDNLAIPQTSKKLELTYKFMDFILSKENMLKNSTEYGYNPANKESYKFIDKKFTNNPSFFPNNHMFKKLHLLKNQIDPKTIEQLWLEVRVL